MNICIAYPNKNLTFSETFITNHLKVPHQHILTGGKCPYLDETGKSIFKFPWKVNIIRALLKNLFPDLYRSIYTYSLKNHLLKKKIDLVFVEYGHTGVNIVNACKKAKVGLVVHFHGFDASVYSIRKTFQKAYIQISEYAKNIIVVSDDMRKELVKLGMRNDNIVKISCGVDPEKFFGARPEENEKVCIFVGRLTPKKAPDKTILAFNEALKEHPDAKLIIVGHGELYDETVKLVKDLNIANSIEFLGVRTSEEIVVLLRKARLFLQHSVRTISGDSEGTPVTILEASASGLPIVSTRHAGIKEAVIHGKTGYLVDEGDFLEMAKYIKLLLGDKQLAGKLGRQAREHIFDNYGLDKQIKMLTNVLYS